MKYWGFAGAEDSGDMAALPCTRPETTSILIRALQQSEDAAPSSPLSSSFPKATEDSERGGTYPRSHSWESSVSQGRDAPWRSSRPLPKPGTWVPLHVLPAACPAPTTPWPRPGSQAGCWESRRAFSFTPDEPSLIPSASRDRPPSAQTGEGRVAAFMSRVRRPRRALGLP